MICATLACASDDGSDLQEADVTARTLSSHGRSIVQVLQRDFTAEKGQLWNVQGGNSLASDLVQQSPSARTWGQALSAPPRCTGSTCEPNFQLRRCQSDRDCGVSHCEVLQATSTRRGTAGERVCLGHSDEQLDVLYTLITSATRQVDIATLSPPDGRFLATFRNAVTVMADRPIVVRVLLGKVPGMNVSAEKLRAELTRDLPRNAKVQVGVAAYRVGLTSWNHAKIVSVDSRSALVGGQNFWEEHYLNSNPVHDVSLKLEGPAAGDATAFNNAIWKTLCAGTNSADLALSESGCPAQFDVRSSATATGDEAIISVGRLGALGKDPADAALVALIDSATRELAISQQDIGPLRVGVRLAAWPTEVLQALARAIAREVDISIILSNPGAMPGTITSSLEGAYGNGWSIADIGFRIKRAMYGLHEVPAWDVGEAICSHLALAPLRATDRDAWSNGANFANHAKFVMADTHVFYVGSQNLYTADLAEFGYIVDSKRAASTIKASYFDKAWQHSKRAAISGPGVANCALRMAEPMPGPNPDGGGGN
jgi:phosphatidylserine/phosphatidylglycerophosphate/cardiolipin synthase-like enzyme